ncbi:MAG: tRNA (adenosine(37)-N6)-dimethylallyltransferase MiaA [Acidobacteria bacterium]|nr:tRNA (adenosine(37)-N6)-dimethylallyltransferase MiaA [Acidobacteriota bacterium]
MSAPPLLVVAGPTASGKSELGLEAAERLGGEIVSADAFAVYRGMDIGTDKPGSGARRRVPHHLIDIADPAEKFSAGDFVRAADEAIADIRSRGKTPVVVGGTHFYIRALLIGLFASPPRDPELRRRLEEAWESDPAALWEELVRVDPDLSGRIDAGDRQRILRALEVWTLSGIPLSEHWRRHEKTRRYNALIVAPLRERNDLYARIDLRVDAMFSSGFVEEVRHLLTQGVSPDAHAMKAIGYRQVVEVVYGTSDLAQAKDSTKRASRHLAKRQLTWLRHLREGDLHWVPPAGGGGVAELIQLWSQHLEESEEV